METEQGQIIDTRPVHKGRGWIKSRTRDHLGQMNFDSFTEIVDSVQKCILFEIFFVYVAVEGFVIFVTGLHEEAAEDDVLTFFAECGSIRQVQLAQDKRTGFAKGYALIEYKKLEDANEAIKHLHGTLFLERKICVSWAFKPKMEQEDSGVKDKKEESRDLFVFFKSWL